MINDFIAEYARLIVSNPDDIKVVSVDNHDVVDIILYAHVDDVGKLIGKHGKMIGAIKTVISGCKAKDGKSYRINVESVEE